MHYKEALKALGLTENCTKSDIVKAYRKLAKKHHPDVGGSEKEMAKLNSAKEVLDEWVENKNDPKYGYQKTNNTTRNTGYKNSRPSGYENTAKSRTSPPPGWGEAWKKYQQAGYTDFYGFGNPGRSTYENPGYNPDPKEYEAKRKDVTGTKPRNKFNKEDGLDKLNTELINIHKKLNKSILSLRIRDMISKIMPSILFIMVAIVFYAFAPNLARVPADIVTNRMLAIGAVLAALVKSVFTLITNSSAHNYPPLVHMNILYSPSGTTINLIFNKKTVGSFKVSKENHYNNWSKVAPAWREVIDSGFCCAAAKDELDTVTFNNLNYNKASVSNRAGVVEFSHSVFVIPMRRYGDFIVIAAGLIIYIDNGLIQIATMDNAGITVDKHYLNLDSDRDGRAKKMLVYSAIFDTDIASNIGVFFSRATEKWDNLII